MPVKDHQIMTNVEEDIYNIVMAYVNKTERSASGYIRGLIIKDLVQQELIPEDLQMKLLAS